MVQSAETIAPISRGKEPFINRVWYGIGKVEKALETQSPEAWQKRIMKLVDEKIVPRLSPDHQETAAKIRPQIETVATGLGIGITTAEIVAAVAAASFAVRKTGELLARNAQRRWQKKNTWWVDAGPGLPKMPVTIAGPASSLSSDMQEKIYTHYFVDRNDTARILDRLTWTRHEHIERGISAIRKTRLAGTVESMLVLSEDPSVQSLLRIALGDTDPSRRPPVAFQQFFIHAYEQAAQRYGWTQVGKGEAKTLYEQWIRKHDKIGYKMIARRTKAVRSLSQMSKLPDPMLEYMSKFIKPGPEVIYFTPPYPGQIWQDLARRMQLDKEPSVLMRMRADGILERFIDKNKPVLLTRKQLLDKVLGAISQEQRDKLVESEIMKRVLKDAIALDPTVIWKKPDIAAKIYRGSQLYPHAPFQQSAADLAQILDRAWQIRGKGDMQRFAKDLNRARESLHANRPEAYALATQILEQAYRSDKKFKSMFPTDGSYYQIHDQMQKLAKFWVNAFHGFGTSNLMEPTYKFGINWKFLMNPVAENR